MGEEEQMKKTLNAQHSTLNVQWQSSELSVERWTLGVGRLLLS
jgi:hypothetical protein